MLPLFMLWSELMKNQNMPDIRFRLWKEQPTTYKLLQIILPSLKTASKASQNKTMISLIAKMAN